MFIELEDLQSGLVNPVGWTTSNPETLFPKNGPTIKSINSILD